LFNQCKPSLKGLKIIDYAEDTIEDINYEMKEAEYVEM
jgi:hypothetical protein